MESNNNAAVRNYTASEVAAALGVSEDTIRRAIRKGKLTAKKMPGNKKTYVITPSDLFLYGFVFCKGSMLDKILKFNAQEKARAEEAMSLNNEELPVWMKRKGSEEPTIANAAQRQSTEDASPLNNITEKKSLGLIELYKDNDSDLYTLMKGTKLRINLIKKLLEMSNEELETVKRFKAQIPETLSASSRERIYNLQNQQDQYIQQVELEVIEHKKALAVETFNLENCRLKDTDHKIEKRIDAEMAASSSDSATDTP